MKSHLFLAAAVLIASCTPKQSCEVLPVTGCYYQMSHDDERYNNMTFEDEILNTDPEMHADKVRALHELGIDLIMFPEVGTFETEYYPSNFLPHRYPEGRKSPIDAIMDTAEELGMKVMLSCGWCFSQYDNIRDSAVIKRSCEIMTDLASIYGDRECFFGWYLPVEDCLSPYFSEHSIPGINRLVAHANKVTPGKKTMVSPWGLYLSDLDNPKFYENLSKVDADIIAMQDEVGCVREAFPLHREAVRLRKLGKICDKIGMEYWVNVESFTWDRGLNNHYSTLIPAHFGRFLSQIVSASQSKPAKIVSFAFNGIYEKPGERFHLGQEGESEYAYTTYKSWLEGDPKWKMLEKMFAGEQKNCAKGCRISYTENGLPSKKLSAGQDYLCRLTDGVLGYEDPTCDEWVSFGTSFDVTIDLGKVRDIKTVAPRFLNYSPKMFRMPSEVCLYTSLDGTDWTLVSKQDGPHVNPDNALHDCWIDISYFPEVGKARYVRLTAPGSLWSINCCDEIFIEW